MPCSCCGASSGVPPKLQKQLNNKMKLVSEAISPPLEKSSTICPCFLLHRGSGKIIAQNSGSTTHVSDLEINAILKLKEASIKFGETLKEKVISPIHIRGDVSTFSCFDVGTEYILFFVQQNGIQTKLASSQSYSKSANTNEINIGSTMNSSTTSILSNMNQNNEAKSNSNNNSATSTLSKNSVQKLQVSHSNISNDPHSLYSSKSTSQLISITTNSNPSKEQSISDICEELKLILTGFSL